MSSETSSASVTSSTDRPGATRNRHEEPTEAAQPASDSVSRLARPAALLAMAAFVFEILFMISPAALYFYSAYGPVLNVLHASSATSWLTSFFLPHYSTTGVFVIDQMSAIGMVLAFGGIAAFLVGFVQIYGAKLTGRGAVAGGIYRYIRHPQYSALIVAGAGTVLMWPRFLVLISFVAMLFVYAALARHEERICRDRFGDAYLAIESRTGRFLPRSIEAMWPLRLEGVQGVMVCAVSLSLTIAGGFALRSWSLSQVPAVFQDDLATLSPAPLPDQRLLQAVQTARSHEVVREKVASSTKLIAYVLPESWYLADIPAEPHPPGSHGHDTPAEFSDSLFKVLFVAPRSHHPHATGRDIVLKAYGREPLVLAHIDLDAGVVTRVDEPIPHVLWGDIPTPLF